MPQQGLTADRTDLPVIPLVSLGSASILVCSKEASRKGDPANCPGPWRWTAEGLRSAAR
jgi:hypothetical protein